MMGKVLSSELSCPCVRSCYASAVVIACFFSLGMGVDCSLVFHHPVNSISVSLHRFENGLDDRVMK